MTISKKLTLIFCVLIAMNLAAGLLLWRATEQVQMANDEVLETTQLMNAVGQLSAAFESEQGAIRAFTISGQQEMVTESGYASQRVAEALEAARAATSDPQMASLLDLVVEKIEGWRTGIRDPMVQLMRHPLTVDEARLFETTGQNDEMIAHVRQIILEISKQVERVTAESAATVEADVAWMRGVVAATVLAMVAMGLFLAVSAARTISAPIRRLTGQMAQLAEGDTGLEIAGTRRKDEIGEMARRVEVFRDNAIERARLEEAARSEHERDAARRRRIEELVTSFRGDVSSVLAQVGDNMGQMRETAQVLAGIAEQTAGRAANVASASEEASTNVQTVATAAEELSASINEISRQVNETTRFVGDATDGARDTNSKVSGLAEMAQRIGDVVSLIQDIAEQTNLLALNATIEAARAGERGKGFAVVASEVKTLAGQTAKATEEIAQQISAIQGSTGSAVSAIQTIASRMEEVNGYTASIAAAVEQQGAATDEISRNVREAASGTEQVVQNVGGLESAAGETSQSAAHVEQVSREAAEQADRLRGIVDRFLGEVAAA